MTEWAIRHPKRGKAHRQLWPADLKGVDAFCGRFLPRPYERVPVDQILAANRCRICWKDET